MKRLRSWGIVLLLLHSFQTYGEKGDRKRKKEREK